eukprot:576962-Prymnesium_polylepis.1
MRVQGMARRKRARRLLVAVRRERRAEGHRRAKVAVDLFIHSFAFGPTVPFESPLAAWGEDREWWERYEPTVLERLAR